MRSKKKKCKKSKKSTACRDLNPVVPLETRYIIALGFPNHLDHTGLEKQCASLEYNEDVLVVACGGGEVRKERRIREWEVYSQDERQASFLFFNLVRRYLMNLVARTLNGRNRWIV